jgi:hypothetical protein
MHVRSCCKTYHAYFVPSITWQVIELAQAADHLRGQEMTMLMLSLVRALAAILAVLAPLAARLATWMVARSLNMPEPLVHATGLFVFAQVQAFENSVLQSLCPARLARRLTSWFR